MNKALRFYPKVTGSSMNDAGGDARAAEWFRYPNPNDSIAVETGNRWSTYSFHHLIEPIEAVLGLRDHHGNGASRTAPYPHINIEFVPIS